VPEKVLTQHFEFKHLFKIDEYMKKGGYKTLTRVLKEIKPEDVMSEVKAASLRGRGGAGFPAGVKWGFVPKDVDKPRYLCVNADEGEPGTFKDRFIMSHNPHMLLEGIVLTCFAVGIHTAYIYIRGEYEKIALRLESAISEAGEKGFIGKNILKTGFDLEVFVHRGAGAYICGEETALLESLEGKRGNPRLKPPFPAAVGLFQSPTVINNVETLSNIPCIMEKGADWFVKQGISEDGGTRLFGVSGKVKNPGVYELPVGTSLKELVFTHAGGIRSGKKLKAVIPGGMSSPILKPDEIDIPMDCKSLMNADSMLGSGAVIVLDEDVAIIDVLRKVTQFYSHESCGQCTPCRIGNSWINKIVKRIYKGEGKKEDVDKIEELASNMLGKTLCPLGDAAAMPVLSIIKKFRKELESFIKG